MSDASPLVLGDLDQDLVGGIKVLPHDRGLVLEHGDEELEGDHVQLLVAQVQAAVLGYVAEQVHGAVEVGNGHDLAADVVVQAVDAVGVDETVADPQPGFDGFLDFAEHLGT